jgi:hypothetical protein
MSTFKPSWAEPAGTHLVFAAQDLAFAARDNHVAFRRLLMLEPGGEQRLELVRRAAVEGLARGYGPGNDGLVVGHDVGRVVVVAGPGG